MSLSFKPAAGPHAIDTCLVVVQLAQPVDPGTLSAVNAAAAVIAADNNLPGRPGQALGIAPQVLLALGQQFPQPGFGLGMSVFQRFAPDGTVEAELRCEPQGVVLQVRQYTGWADLRALLGRTVLSLLPIYLSGLPAIASVRLQYDDRFVAQVSGDVSAGEIFRTDTRWIASYDPATDQQWHSHFGLFIKRSDDERELINVNVNLNDQIIPLSLESSRVAGLTIMVGRMFEIPGRAPLLVEPEKAAAQISEILEGLHNRHKEILSEVLSDNYLREIGC